jgi:VCBS repeat-containing protein
MKCHKFGSKFKKSQVITFCVLVITASFSASAFAVKKNLSHEPLWNMVSSINNMDLNEISSGKQGSGGRNTLSSPSQYEVEFLPRVIVVHIDEDNDTGYNFLASIPMTVFHHNNKVYQSLIISDHTDDEPTKYIMDDWKTYLDEWGGVQHINFIGEVSDFKKEEIMDLYEVGWEETSNITGDPIKVANEIALHDWRYSSTVVIAPYLSDLSKHDIESISNAAVIASLYNAPLLFTEPSSLSTETLDVIDEIDAVNAILVEIGDSLDSYINSQLNSAGVSVTDDLINETMVVSKLRDLTNYSMLCGIRLNWQNLPASLYGARYGGYVLFLPETLVARANSVGDIIKGLTQSYYKLTEPIDLPFEYKAGEEEIAKNFYDWLDSIGGNDTEKLETVTTFNTQPYYDSEHGFDVTFERAISGDPSDVTTAGAVSGRMPLRYIGNIALANRDGMYRATIFSNPRPYHVTISLNAYEVWHEVDATGPGCPDKWGTNHIINEIFGYPYRGWCEENGNFPWQDIHNNTPDLSPILPPGPGDGPDCDPGQFASFNESHEAHFHSGSGPGPGSHPAHPHVQNIGFVADLNDGSTFVYFSAHGSGTSIGVREEDNGVAQDPGDEVPWGEDYWPSTDGRVYDGSAGGSYSQDDLDSDVTNVHGSMTGYNACLMANGKMNEVILEHGGCASFASYTSVSFDGSGWWWNIFGYLITHEDYTIGEAATYATARIARVYTPGAYNGPGSVDDSLQYVVFGDPNMPFFQTDWSSPEPEEIDVSYGGHIPDKTDVIKITDVQATPSVQEPGGWVNITCNVSAQAGVNQVKVNITYPNGSFVNQTMINIPGTESYYHNDTYSLIGTYTYYIWANDVEGNSTKSSTYSFLIATPEQLDQHQTQGTYNFVAYGSRWGAQSFKPTLETLTRVELLVRKRGNPPNNLVVSIRDSLTGDDLTMVSKPPSEIPSTVEWIEFDFEDISVTPNGTYYIVLRTTGGNTLRAYIWRFGYNTPYTDGEMWFSSNAGSNWKKYRQYDFCFKTYGRTTPPNIAPVAEDDSYTTPEDTQINVDTPGVLENDHDPDDGPNPLTCVLVDDVTHGTLTLNSDGSFTYNPDPDYYGTDSFTYRAFDGMDYSNLATVSINVESINDPPTAVDDSYTTPENTQLNVAAPGVLGNDIDDSPLTAVLVDDVTHGTLTLNSDGSFTYTPDTDYVGTDSFTYQAYDGEYYSNVATVTITIYHVNDPPVAEDDTYTTSEDTQLSVDAPGVLENDYDPDDGPNPLTCVLVDDVTHGTLTLNSDGSFTYNPDPDYTGTDSFTYQAYDGEDYSNTATVTIDVTSVNDPPVAVDDTAETAPDTPVEIPVTDNDYDIDGTIDTTTVTIQTDASHGSTEVDPVTGVVTYTPDPGYEGPDSFTYTVNDNEGASSNIATVNITVVSPEELDQEQTQGNYNFLAYGDRWGAQSFKPTLGTLTRVELRVQKKGNPPGNLVVSIRDSLTGEDLTMISKPPAETPSEVDWIDFDFEDISVTPGSTYYIVLRTTGGNSQNSYIWKFGYNTPYIDGRLWFSSNAGSSWTSYIQYDFCFKTYGIS